MTARILILQLGLFITAFLTACEPPAPPPPPPEPLAPSKPAPALPPHVAARQGELDQLKIHLSLGMDINVRDEYGATLLHEAASAGHVRVVEWLIEQGAVIDARDESGFEPVQLASFMDHQAVVDLLLRHGAELDVIDEAEELVDEDMDVLPEEPLIVDEPTMPDEWKELEFREWTSATGRTLEAAFLELQQDVVSLGSRDGRVSRIPIIQLHRDDQILARQLAMAGQAPTLQRPGSRGGVDLQPTRVTAGFSSECERILVRAIQQARQEVLVAIYTITRPQIEQALSAAARRGVSVKVKYDAGQAPTSRMQELINRMESRGVVMIPIHMSGRYASMHHKFAVIDGEQVFTGSFNFTVMAITQNYENCVLIESSSVAGDFAREFDRIRGR